MIVDDPAPVRRPPPVPDTVETRQVGSPHPHDRAAGPGGPSGAVAGAPAPTGTVAPVARPATVGHTRPEVPCPRTPAVVWAFLRRDWAIARSYKLPFVMGLVQTFATLGFLYYLARLVGPRIGVAGGHLAGGYFSYAVLGTVALSTLTTTLTSVAQRLRADQTTGTMEILFTMPPRPAITVLASAAYPVAFALVVAAIELSLSVGVFGMRFDADLVTAAAAAADLVASLLLGAAAGMALAAFVVVFKRGEGLTALAASVLSMIGGVYYPVHLLPPPLHVLAAAIPFTWALDVLRQALLGHRVLVPQLAGLWVAAVAALSMSSALLGAGLRRARRLGTLAQY